MSRRRRILSIAWKALAILVVLLVYAAWPGRQTFTVSPETTYVTGPLDKDGYVDYVTALNERLSKRITPENNANVLILKAIGPWVEDRRTMPTEYYEFLGIDPPPDKGEYFIRWGRDFDKDDDRSDNIGLFEEHMNRLDSAAEWPWKSSEKPDLARWLKQNEKALEIVVEASQRPNYYNPILPKRVDDWSFGLINSELPVIWRWDELARALWCRAMMHVGEGNAVAAGHDLLACHRLARLLMRGGTFVEGLHGIAIDLRTSEAELILLNRTKLNVAQILAYRDEWKQLAAVPSFTEKMDFFERFTVLEIMMLTARYGQVFLDELPKGGFAPSERIQLASKLFSRSKNWDPALRKANRCFDRCIAAMRIKDREAREKEATAITEEIRATIDRVKKIGALRKELYGPEARGESIGDILTSYMLPAFQKVQNAALRCEQAQHNMEVAFALAAFRADQKQYPAKLEELVPKYISKLPVDMFSNRPLIYRLTADGYFLNSVGPNGLDEDGRRFADEPAGDDVCIHMPVPAPREKK